MAAGQADKEPPTPSGKYGSGDREGGATSRRDFPPLQPPGLRWIQNAVSRKGIPANATAAAGLPGSLNGGEAPPPTARPPTATSRPPTAFSRMHEGVTRGPSVRFQMSFSAKGYSVVPLPRKPSN